MDALNSGTNHFSDEQIEIARSLKKLGLSWTPQVGHYVYDAQGICPKGSPFQDRVYFLLDYACFMRHVGGQERFVANMVWLPTWEDCRLILRELKVPDAQVLAGLKQAFAENQEVVMLYRLIHRTLAELHENTSPKGRI